MIKDIDVSVEDIRIDPENHIFKYGPIVTNKTAWREAERIPLTAPSIWETNETLEVGSGENLLSYHKYTSGVVAFYERFPLKLYQKSDSFYSEFLINLIPPSWDRNNLSYSVKFYRNDLNLEIPYGMGNPEVDNSAGVIKFDKDFVEDLIKTNIEYPISVSFYRYEGILGFYGSQPDEQFPRPDNLPLIKSSENSDIKARFKINVDENTTKDLEYILPTTIQATGIAKALVTEGNFYKILQSLLKVDGGVYLPD